MAFLGKLGRAVGAFGAGASGGMTPQAGNKRALLAGAAANALGSPRPPMGMPGGTGLSNSASGMNPGAGIGPGINTGPSPNFGNKFGLMRGPMQAPPMQAPPPMMQPDIVQPPNVPDYTNAPPPLYQGSAGMLGRYGGNRDPRFRF